MGEIEIYLPYGFLAKLIGPKDILCFPLADPIHSRYTTTLQNGAKTKKALTGKNCKCLICLVELDGIEPTTS